MKEFKLRDDITVTIDGRFTYAGAAGTFDTFKEAAEHRKSSHAAERAQKRMKIRVPCLRLSESRGFGGGKQELIEDEVRGLHFGSGNVMFKTGQHTSYGSPLIFPPDAKSRAVIQAYLDAKDAVTKAKETMDKHAVSVPNNSSGFKSNDRHEAAVTRLINAIPWAKD